MAAKAKEKKEKVKVFSVAEYNKGFKRREINVGDRVTAYKIPYRHKQAIGTGIVKKIFYIGEYSAFCDVLMDGHDIPNGHIIYLGRVYEGWQKP